MCVSRCPLEFWDLTSQTWWRFFCSVSEMTAGWSEMVGNTTVSHYLSGVVLYWHSNHKDCVSYSPTCVCVCVCVCVSACVCVCDVSCLFIVALLSMYSKLTSLFSMYNTHAQTNGLHPLTRAAACLACGNFMSSFPGECRPTLPQLLPLFFSSLEDSMPSVRQGAASSLATLVYNTVLHIMDTLVHMCTSPHEGEWTTITTHPMYVNTSFE